ncbi:BAG-associated GRAM protein 1 isoform X2 [Brachypodium distachyon]|uniref:BAG-associated GRAM protein 1 isoform X2 n=1 Tax=Brachypodium distachyon TaxID=15368 RepID=UPI00071C463B|nr:BAG-associated GRAM protein 1 isoform X2 [Brachypodium distachyon]|eukprot:XP_014756501.1 BAG-associated GRAM protein 1 isoform X2 [Brachypodium distachyon]
MMGAQYCSWLLGFLLPSLWEAEVAVSATALLAATVALLLILDQSASNGTTTTTPTTSSPPPSTARIHHRDGRRRRSSARGKKAAAPELRWHTCEITSPPADGSPRRGSSSTTTNTYVIKVELVSAKYLIGANLNGTSEPYAVISLGEQKRFSSMVPSSRNPLWGQGFNFLARELPAEVTVTIYDWDNVCKCKVIGSVTVAILGEDKTESTWYDLDSRSGQVCMRISSMEVFNSDSSIFFSSYFNQHTRVDSQRKMTLNKQRLAMIEDSGPLQAMFEFPHDEIVQHSYSCALERCFLHYGRMYISSWHLCFHSKVFAKQLNVIIPLQDINEIKRSQHSLINPAIIIYLHTGAGGHGAPPLCCQQNGSFRYKFTSFWNRNRTFRALETALQIYRANLEAEKQVFRKYSSWILPFTSCGKWQLSDHLYSCKQVRAHSLQGQNMNVSSRTYNIRTEDRNIERAVTFEQATTFQPFINEHVLVDVTSNTFPGTPEKFFTLILGDNPIFIQQYRDARKDTDLKMSKWYASDEYGGNVREVTFRSLCHSPLCPTDTAVTELQHTSFSKDKRNLIYETKQQAHDVPFGSYFEIHCRWSLRKTSSSTCQVNIKIGVNMKKWCILQSKIKSGATDEERSLQDFAGCM